MKKYDELIICSEREKRILHACLGLCINLRDKAFFQGYFCVSHNEATPSLEEIKSLMIRLFPNKT